MAWSFECYYKGQHLASVAFYNNAGAVLADVLEKVFYGPNDSIRKAYVWQVGGKNDFIVKLADYNGKEISRYEVQNVAKIELIPGMTEAGEELAHNWEQVIA